MITMNVQNSVSLHNHYSNIVISDLIDNCLLYVRADSTQAQALLQLFFQTFENHSKYSSSFYFKLFHQFVCSKAIKHIYKK